MKAGGFDPLNHVARKAVEDAIAAYLSELNTDPVGYVTKLVELTKLRLGVGCVDLFGKVVPKGFEMVPVFAAPPAEGETKPITLGVLRNYFRAMEAGDVPDPALALYSYLLMDGFVPKSSASEEVRAALATSTLEGRNG